jgi:hypothetical protein
MNRTRIVRWSFAAVTAVSLAFGGAQAFAAPGAQKANGWCDPYQCANWGCPDGCGPGWCGPGGCYCHC